MPSRIGHIGNLETSQNVSIINCLHVKRSYPSRREESAKNNIIDDIAPEPSLSNSPLPAAENVSLLFCHRSWPESISENGSLHVPPPPQIRDLSYRH